MKTSLAVALSVAFGVSTNLYADTVSMSWSGAFTMLNASGAFVPLNDPGACLPGMQFDDFTCLRSAINGTLTLDTVTGAGSGAIAPFSFGGVGNLAFTSFNLQTIGDGAGGPGSLVLGNLNFNWNGNNGIPVSIVWDASGLLTVLTEGVSVGQTITGGALPASDNTLYGNTAYPIGPVIMATTTWDTTNIGTPTFGSNPSGTLPLATSSVTDVTNGDIGVGGSPMQTPPFGGYNANIDIHSAQVTSVVPVPSAVWLFGSGLAGLVSLTRRRRGTTAKHLG